MRKRTEAGSPVRQQPPPTGAVTRRALLRLAVVALATAPLPFIGRAGSSLLGVPLWLWWSGGMTFLLSALTAWTVVCHWPETGADEEGDR